MSYSDVGCVTLHSTMNCDVCKMKMHEVLTSIAGDYSVTIDAEEGTVKISGEMDPNILMKAINRNGRHAELKWLRLSTPMPNRGYHYNTYDGYVDPHGYGNQGLYGYRDSEAWPLGMYRESPHSYYPDRRAGWDYPDYNNNNNYGYGSQYNSIVNASLAIKGPSRDRNFNRVFK